MKPVIASLAFSLLFAHTATALEVTNLDTVPHEVVLEVAGSREVRRIMPDDTEYFVGMPNGFLSLATAQKPKKAEGVIQSDGLLSGVFSNGRSSGLPAENRDAFVIWPDGNLMLQQRRRGGKQNR